MVASTGETLDNIIRRNAGSDNILLSYPVDEHDYIHLTGPLLERLSRAAAVHYSTKLDECVRRHRVDGTAKTAANSTTPAPRGPVSLHGYGKQPVVALLGMSKLEYYIALIAVQRLGLTVMTISPRLADPGYVHLLRVTDCRAVIASDHFLDTIARVRRLDAQLEVSAIPMLDLGTNMQLGTAEPPLAPVKVDAQHESGLILHTGGTTGLPKPVFIPMSLLLSKPEAKDEERLLPLPDSDESPGLSTLPLFHSFGLGKLVSYLESGRHLVLLNADRPVTAAAVFRGLDALEAKALMTVPYVVKFLLEAEGGVEKLARLSRVIVGGAAVTDDMCKRLVEAGVNIDNLYGQTECGYLMTKAVVGVDEWNWLTPLPATKPWLDFEPVSGLDGVFHLVVKKGIAWQRLTDRPDGGYNTKDLFVKHPTRPDTYKYRARADDMIVLVNGEKADPNPLEAAINGNPLVRLSVACGQGRDRLCMLIVPHEHAASLSREEIVARILPDLEAGNSRAATYARVSADDVIIKPADTTVPMTAKSTVIRPEVYRQFEQDINEHYTSRESVRAEGEMSAATEDEMRETVRRIVQDEMRLDPDKRPLGDDVDWFDMGMDSLQALHVRMGIMKTIPLNGRKLPTNLAFDYSTVAALTRFLVRSGTGTHAEYDAETVARALIDKYSEFSAKSANELVRGEGSVVLLTGATGYIGREIVYYLLTRPSVSRVYCLVRARDHEHASQRLTAALEDGRFNPPLATSALAKLTSLAADLGKPDLGLSPDLLTTLQGSVTETIHNAWSVNFNMSIASFESQHVAGLHHLLNLAITSPLQPPPSFTFISSVATIMRTTAEPVPETALGWDAVLPSGYGQSKYVGERICDAAGSQRLSVRVVRPAQISGDSRAGRWNPAEAIPNLVRTAKTLGALPDRDESMVLLPADACGEAVVDIALHDHAARPGCAYFHVASHADVSWKHDFLPAIRDAGIAFDTVSAREWLRRLEANADVATNPPYKLLEYYKVKYRREDGGRPPRLDMNRARVVASGLGRGGAVDRELLRRYVTYWVEEGWK